MKTTLFVLFSAGLFLIGFSYLYYPAYIAKINKWLKQKVFNDDKINVNRKKFGIVYILLSFIIVYMGVIMPRIRTTTNEQYLRTKLNLSWLYFNQGKYSEALKLCESALKTNAENPAALQQMCVICFTTGDYEKAKLYCLKALKKNPDNLKVKNIYDRIIRKTKK